MSKDVFIRLFRSFDFVDALNFCPSHYQTEMIQTAGLFFFIESDTSGSLIQSGLWIEMELYRVCLDDRR